MSWYIVLPSLKISGGNIEALQLGKELTALGDTSRILCMWPTQQPLASELEVSHLMTRGASAKSAILGFPSLLARFRRFARREGTAAHFMFTHYATMPLSLFVPRARRFFFVQDLEWHFLGTGVTSRVLRRIILGFYRRGRVLSANSYLTSALRKLDVAVEADLPIWANPAFVTPGATVRDIDFVMVLRTGAHKRLDLYHSFIDIANKHPGLRVAVISPDDALIAAVQDRVAVALLRPTAVQMRDLYSRSKCFVHLSDHEGFGLPPLEAMAAGCVPICRDSGGVRAFMSFAPLTSLLMPLDVLMETVFARAQALLGRPDWPVLSDACRDIFQQGVERARTRGPRLERLVASREGR